MTFFGHAAAQLSQWWATTTATEMIWLGVGFLAQLMFSMRFIVQWIASERARRSIVPETFWYFSMVGGAMLFAYAIYRLDPVFMLGQGMGLLIYARNIYFIRAHNRAAALAAEGAAACARNSRPAAPAERLDGAHVLTKPRSVAISCLSPPFEAWPGTKASQALELCYKPRHRQAAR